MNRDKFYLLLFATTVAAAPATLRAQTATGDDHNAVSLQEIIVTAQKRSERMSDVPLSITAATGEQLAKAGVDSPNELTKVVPGFTYQPSNYGPPVYSIRGVGFFDNSVASSPTVTVYTDQAPLPYLAMAAGATLDLERVEVLKGPQGTLFGQNSTGGAVNFIAAKPTRQLSYGASAEYQNFGQVSLDGFVSGPVSETLGVRLAARTEQGGAWQESISRPGEKLGDRDFTTARMIVQWSPSDAVNLMFNVNGWIDKSETQAAQFIRYSPTAPTYQDLRDVLLATPPAPDDNHKADWDPNTNLKKNDKFFQLSLRGDFTISDKISLTTITAYSKLNAVDPVDGDGTQYNNFYVINDAALETVSQEIRLSGQSFADKLRWLVGGNYGHDDTQERQFFMFTGSNNGVGPFRYHQFLEVNDVKVNTYAVFGSLEYQFTDTVSAQASARYTKETQDGRSCLADSGNGELAQAFSLISLAPLAPGSCVTFASPVPAGPPPFTPVGGFVNGRLDEHNVAWRGNLSWKPTGDMHFYVNITKGYKAGSFSTLPLVFSSQYEPVPQESVLAYEAGFKISALDHTLQTSGALFYYDYNDKQILGYVLTPFGNLPGLVTVPKSRTEGGELNLNWRPVEGLTLNAGVTYIDTRVLRSFVTRDPFANEIDIKGYSFPITPKWQFSADGEYSFAIAPAVDAFFGTSVTYRSSTPATFGGGSEFVLPAYTLVDLRAGVESKNGRWRAELWGRNVFDKFYEINASHIVDTIARVTGRPATYGITLSTKY